MQIRKATSKDVGVLVSLAISFRNHLERSEPTDAQFEESIGRLLNSADSDYYLAFEDGMPVGYVLQRFRFSMWASGVEATLEDLFVEPSARKNGAGKALVSFALDQAKALGCATVCLDTNENNVASTRIYTRFGFNALSKRWNGRQIFFRLKLDEARL